MAFHLKYKKRIEFELNDRLTGSLTPDLRSAFRRALSPNSPHAVFPATAIAAALTQSVLLFLSFNSEGGDGWSIFQVSDLSRKHAKSLPYYSSD